MSTTKSGSTIPIFNTEVSTPLCEDAPGFLNGNPVQSVTWTALPPVGVSELADLPDATGVAFTSELFIDFFDTDQVLEDCDDIELIIHAAAQPSHDWAKNQPFIDFDINAKGTLNLLELTRIYTPKAPFIFMSTNKVYGDIPNKIPLVEKYSRYEPKDSRLKKKGISEKMSIDDSKHSIFGASKVAADIAVQEYGKYFNLNTVCFRAGCLTGPSHSGAELHGFLSYLVKCCLNGKLYTIYGYKGKQVRDNIHSNDLVKMFWEYIKKPTKGEVYNVGGGIKNSCSILEAIKIIEIKTRKKMLFKFTKKNRVGDHIWYVSNLQKFKKAYPKWKMSHNLDKIVSDIIKEQSRV